MSNKALTMLNEKKFPELIQALKDMEPADIALMLDELPEEHLALVFRMLPKELAAEVFVEMDGDDQELLIRSFSDRELKDVIEELYVDDAVDIIEEMPANVVTRILKYTDPEMRKTINELLKYPKDSAGSIMTTEMVVLKKNMTVEDAFVRIRLTGIDKETIYTCYITDENRKLTGIVTAKTLMLTDHNEILENIMETNPISVQTIEDQEAVAQTFRKYDFLALPVVDTENRLVGIITVDDVIDVINEEATEDIEMMAAITPTDKPYMRTGVFETWKKRIPWLLLLMISATFTGSIITYFEDALAAQVVLTAFIPMLMDTGGQASVTIIRGLALDELAFRDMPKIIWKEMRVALACGITLATANFAKLMLIDRVSLSVAGVVCITLISTVFFAKIVGCTLPMLAKKVGFDPAVMASPFITTIVDAISLLVYFRIAAMLLNF